MVEYKNYYIAFLDILGFSNSIGKETADAIHNIFKWVKEARRLTQGSYWKDTDINELQKHTKFLFFSDTIVCAIPCDIPGAFEMITSHCMLIQHALYSANTPALLRGAVVKGRMYIHGNEMFGPGLIDAYKLEESLAIYPRIIMTKQTYKDGIEHSNNGEDIGYVADTDDGLKMVETLRYTDGSMRDGVINLIRDAIAQEKNPHVREKYLWLRDHYNLVKREYEEPLQ